MNFERHILADGQEGNEGLRQTYLEIQSALIQHECTPGDDLDACVLNWIKEKGGEYEEAFKDIYAQHQNITEMWTENQSRVLELFHERLGQIPSMPDTSINIVGHIGESHKDEDEGLQRAA